MLHKRKVGNKYSRHWLWYYLYNKSISTKTGTWSWNKGCPDIHKRNDPQWQRSWSGPELRRNGRFNVRPKSVFWPKKRFFPKKHPKFATGLIFILEKGPFLFAQLFPKVARTWLELRSALFLARNLGFWPKKIDFCHTTPILDNGPFVALREMLHFPPWGQFFDFLFPSYGRLRKKKTVDAS